MFKLSLSNFKICFDKTDIGTIINVVKNVKPYCCSSEKI